MLTVQLVKLPGQQRWHGWVMATQVKPHKLAQPAEQLLLVASIMPVAQL
jgi:hypothetical protein